MSIARLQEIGFKDVGEWKLLGNNTSIQYFLNQYEDETQILYAFVSESTVYYIGKTDNSLKTRMNGYKNASASQRTNIRVQTQIRQLLNRSKDLQIFVMIDNSNYVHNHVKIRLSAGLEDNLIDIMRPEWNFRGNSKTRIKEEIETNEDENVVVESNQQVILDTSNQKMFSINTSELSHSRINFPKKVVDYSLLPEFDSMVRVYLGKESEVYFEAKLKDTGGGNARINKSVLKDWYVDERLSEQETFKLEILNKFIFRVSK